MKSKTNLNGSAEKLKAVKQRSMEETKTARFRPRYYPLLFTSSSTEAFLVFFFFQTYDFQTPTAEFSDIIFLEYSPTSIKRPPSGL